MPLAPASSPRSCKGRAQDLQSNRSSEGSKVHCTGATIYFYSQIRDMSDKAIVESNEQNILWGNFPTQETVRGMGKSYRRNDFWACLGRQALFMIG